MPQIDLSFTAIFTQATGVVQAVLLTLILCSVLCWTVILEKSVALISLRRQAGAFDRWARSLGASFAMDGLDNLGAAILASGRVEWTDVKPGESLADRRDRIERAMRDTVVSELLRAETRLPYLATIGSAAPFIGLFGTVWGIMHAFTGIAHSNDTSLAVVAPGIAEALSATAIGLVAAIPASIAYNKLAGDFSSLARNLSLSIGILVRRAADDRSGVSHDAA